MARKSATGKSLVIVESPAKAKTINKYLGDEYVVRASMGHVRDLPAHDFGIDLTNEFQPTYEVVRGRTKVISELRKLAEGADRIYLATDRDREGEAIAWHLVESLKLSPEKTSRVIFNEITKTAIRAAFDHPQALNLDRVNAQQARRILDRIVGYELSPLLWRKIAKGLSAGRVQSVAVRLIVEREREIRAFHPEEHWELSGAAAPSPLAPGMADAWSEFRSSGERTQRESQDWLSERHAFRVELTRFGEQPFDARDAATAARVSEALGFRVERIDRQPWAEYSHLGLERAGLIGHFDAGSAPSLTVADLTTKRTQSRPSAPFTTAALQQAASTALRFSASRTMRVAQGLYEGVDLAGEGAVGLITYMRTDSTNLSAEAVQAARQFIRNEFGDRYLPSSPNVYSRRQERAQEAHEAIRPTDPHRTPQSVRGALTDEQYKLYDLIWRRFVACQMPPAEWDSTSVKLTAPTAHGVAEFSASGRKLIFDGFMKVAGVSSEDQLLPTLAVGAAVNLFGLEPRQQFTSPPPRYTEASLVKTLESEGIGRPSTYAAIIDTVQERGYVEQEDRKFFPTALGELVTEKLVAHFPDIVNVKFTSFMEDELDKIEDAHLDWVRVLHEFYDPFRSLLERAGDEMEPARSQPSTQLCPTCGAAMVFRWSKRGRFLSCSSYPTCKATLNVDRNGRPLAIDAAAHACEQCGKPMALRQSRTGYFLGCTGYPDCRNTVACDSDGQPLKVVEAEALAQPCPACGEGTLRVKWKARRAFLACDRYPSCKHAASVPPEIKVKRPPAPPPEDAGVACEKCGRAMVIREGSRGKFVSCSGFPKCRNAKPLEKLDQLKAAAAARAAEGGPVDAPTAGKHTAAPRGEPGTPPPGFAMTRTGKPVVERLPEGDLHCPECGGVMEMRRGRFGPFFSCGNFPRCKFVANLRGEAKKAAEELMPGPARPKPVPTDIACEECGSPMLLRQGPRGRFLGCSAYPKCKATRPVPADFQAPVSSGAT